MAPISPIAGNKIRMESGIHPNEDGWMLKDTTTPDGYYVDENGVWNGTEV